MMRMRYTILLLAVDLQAQGLKGNYPNLQRSLQLTDSQWVAMTSENEAYQRFLFEKSQRVTQANRELALEQLRPAPDPMALGVRYVEIGTICQESRSRFVVYREALRQVLTAEQQARLAQLEAGQLLLPAIAEAQDLTLVGTEVKEAAPPNPDLPRDWRAIRSYASGSPLPGCPNSGYVGRSLVAAGRELRPTEYFPNLVRHLDLTDDQLIPMIDLGTRFERGRVERQYEVQAIRSEMSAESARPVPDSAALGAKAAHLEEICRELQAKESELQTALPAMLTEPQDRKSTRLNSSHG